MNLQGGQSKKERKWGICVALSSTLRLANQAHNESGDLMPYQ